MEQEPIFEDLTLALEAFLDARARLIHELRIDVLDARVDRLVVHEQEALRSFIVKLTERGTGMAASAAMGIIKKYLDDIHDIKDRLERLEAGE